MKKIFILLSLFAGLNAFAQTEETRTVDAFTGVSSASGVNVQLVKGSGNKVIVSTSDEKVLPYFKTEVKDGILRVFIEYENNKNWNKRRYSKNLKLKATVFYSQINTLKASSGSLLEAKELLEANSFTVETSSGATLNAAIKAANISLEASSGSVAAVSGTATEQKIKTSSGAVINNGKLNSKSVTINASSGSMITVNATEAIHVDASSGANIKCYGNPKQVTKKLSSGASLKNM
jgi:Putative auto-transporter adhesin, head GIN domain